jgi:hypothetical protein
MHITTYTKAIIAYRDINNSPECIEKVIETKSKNKKRFSPDEENCIDLLSI